MQAHCGPHFMHKNQLWICCTVSYLRQKSFIVFVPVHWRIPQHFARIWRRSSLLRTVESGKDLHEQSSYHHCWCHVSVCRIRRRRSLGLQVQNQIEQSAAGSISGRISAVGFCPTADAQHWTSQPDHHESANFRSVEKQVYDLKSQETEKRFLKSAQTHFQNQTISAQVYT